MKRIVALTLALLMAALPLASCANTPAGTESTTAAATQPGETAAPEETTATEYRADVEPFDWGGKEFTILVRKDDGEWHDVDFLTDGLNGEPINDAVYNRNTRIEDMFNIKIKVIESDNRPAAIRKAVKAGDSTYDIVFNNPFDNAALSQEGMLLDLFNVPNLDLTQPWWDQNAVHDLTIANRLYQVVGDIGTMYRKSVGIILFNKTMIRDYALDDPYKLVTDHKWTLDAFLNMSRAVSADLNGDGKYTDQDKFGLLGYCDIGPVSMIGSGVQFAGKDQNDMPVITFMSDKTVAVWEKLTSILFQPELFWSWSKNASDNARSREMFANGQGLFNWNEFHSIPDLRSMETDFGILPMPLYDENQSRYYHTVNPHVANMLSIPLSNSDPEKTGAVLSAMGAIGKNILTPAYYDISLKGKHARDNESIATMDLIFSSLTFDLGYLNNWGNIATFTLGMIDGYKPDLVSNYDKLSAKAQTALDKMIEQYQKLS